MAYKLTLEHYRKMKTYANKIAGENVIVNVVKRTDGYSESYNLLKYSKVCHDRADDIFLPDGVGINLDFEDLGFSRLDCCYYTQEKGEPVEMVGYFTVKFKREGRKAVIIGFDI